MKSLKISDNIFLKEDIYYVIEKDIVFARSFSLDDMYSAKSILIKYNWDLNIIQGDVIHYKSGFFRVFRVENNLLKLVVKIKEDDVGYDYPKSSFIFLNGDYYFLIKDSKILGVFNSLNHALIAETFLNGYSWNLKKLLYQLYYVLEYWIVIDIENGVLTFLNVSLFKDDVKLFLDKTGLYNFSNYINPNDKKEFFNSKNEKSGKRGRKKISSMNSSNLFKKEITKKKSNNVKKISKNDSKSNFNSVVRVYDMDSDFSFRKLSNLNKIDDFVYKRGNEFVVIKSSTFYGFSNNKCGVYLIISLLDEIGWDINKLNNLNRIPYKYGYYWVINTSRGYISCIDSFLDYGDAYDCYNSLLSYNNNKYSIGFNFSSSSTSKKNLENISIIKPNKDFHLIREFNGKTKLFGIFSSKKFANVGKSILEKNKWNLNKIGENNSIFYVQDSYWVVNVKNELLNLCQNFDSYDEAYNFVNGISYEKNVVDLLDKFPVKIKSNELKRYEKFVFEKDDNFLIIKSDILFGVSYSKEGIGVLKQVLDDIDWNHHKFNTIGNIVYKNNYYWVMDYSKGYILCVDFFKDYDGALECFESKNFDKSIHFADSTHKNVVISKSDGQYRLTAEFKGNTLLYGVFPFKKYAEIAKLILEKNNWNLNIISKDNIFFENGYYWIINVVDDLLIVLGNFNSYDEAFEYYKGINYDLDSMYYFLTKPNDSNFENKNYLSEIKSYRKSINKTNGGVIKKPRRKFKNSFNSKKEVNSSNQKINDYIYKINDSYHIFNMVDGEFIHFGEFNSLNKANNRLRVLMDNNWNVD
ncbi:hypothetical protein [Methanobrevibacter sp.]|uniref:hypothetical protein n=1 Tax=Methanobrevibacter sp. TaxID=66852 RepID=UPI002E794AC6|nr:hypothetical protein [Methanobrevibacter sp.]MEE0024324.1 hypothetical protein [Methanobrevibacter sp.]